MRCALDAVAATGLDRDDLLVAVDVELARLAGPFVGRDLEIERLPLVADRVAEAAKPDEPAARRHEALSDETARGSEDGGLRVAKA
jgi:hypothetical protein